MIELSSYRIVVQKLNYTREEAADAVILDAICTSRQQRVNDYLEALVRDYDAQEDHDSYFKIKEPLGKFDRVLDVTSTAAFKKFLQSQNSEITPVIEEDSGAQFAIFAAFVPCPYQTNVHDSFGQKLTTQFYQVCRGIQPGKTLTQAEADARVAMNDELFDRLSEKVAQMKERCPDHLFEIQEKSLGSFYMTVTTVDNKEGGINIYEVGRALRELTHGGNLVSAALEGPKLYPSDIAEARAKKAEEIQKQPRKPKSLDL